MRTHSVALIVAVFLFACEGSNHSASANKRTTAPSGDVDNLLAPYVGLCSTRSTELTAALCTSSRDNCDPGCTYYLSADGDDGADGKAGSSTGNSGPWKTLNRLTGIDLADGESVCFRRGDTFRGYVKLPWGKQHTTPVIFQSYGDQALSKPVLSGGTVLPKTWTPTAQSGSIFKIDLTGTLWQGATFTRNGLSYTPHDRVYQLFVNGQGMHLARFPNFGGGDSTVEGVEIDAGNYSVIDSFPSTTAIVDGALPAASPLVTPTNFTGASLYYKSIRWVISYSDVATHDANGHSIKTATEMGCASAGGTCAGWGYFLVDSLSALDAPGEWFFDVATKQLYFWPPAAVDLTNATVEASVYHEDVEPESWEDAATKPKIVTTIGFDMQGASGLRVRNLTFQHYSRTAIWESCDLNSSSADDHRCATNVWIDGCDFIDTGASGVVLARWTAPSNVDAGNRISQCNFRNQNSQAIVLRTTGTEVSCNNISDIGRLENYSRFGMTRSEFTENDQGMALISEMGDQNKFLFNRFERTASAGLSFRSPNQVIAFNYFRNACFTKSDCGAIHTYTWNDSDKFNSPSVSGSLLARNVILETKGATEGGSVSDGWVSPLGSGMFLDLGAHDFTVAQNLIAGNTTSGIMHQRNRNVTTEDNLLYDNTRSNNDGYLLGSLSVINDYAPTNGTFRNNAIVVVDKAQTTLVIRESSVAGAGVFTGNTYFDPFSWDTRTKDDRWDGFNVYHIGDGAVVNKYSLEAWQAVDATAKGAFVSWPTLDVATSGENLITNGDFTVGSAGWRTESWSPSVVGADSHADLGPALKYSRNGATGGRIGGISNTFDLQANHTYMVRFWIAPDPTSETKEPFVLLLGDSNWLWVPNDRPRRVTYFVTPTVSKLGAEFELSPYPLFANQFWIDDVEVRDVATATFHNSTIVRFDGVIPTNARSVLVYNDTEDSKTVSLPENAFVKLDGSIQGSSLTIKGFCGEVLIPVAFSKDSVKTK